MDVDQGVSYEYEIEHFSQSCLCGSDNCRGEVKGWKDLSRDEKESIREYTVPFLRHILDAEVLVDDSQVKIGEAAEG